MATDNTKTQTPPRTDLDFAYFRKRLEDERRMAEETIETTRKQEGSPSDGSVSDETEGMGTVGQAGRSELNAGLDNHPADNATELFLREEGMALVKNAQEVISRINRALEKIEDGTYGLSDRSKQPIPAERLEALPYATLTADEQEIQEQS